MFLPFKRYVDFEGRSTRLEYWMFTLLWWIVIILFTGMIIVETIALSTMFSGSGADAQENHGGQP